jgi:hypothetical protein
MNVGSLAGLPDDIFASKNPYFGIYLKAMEWAILYFYGHLVFLSTFDIYS